MPAILFGSIGAIAETSERQRAAFNGAFEAHGLAWRWDRDDYRALLERSGGAQRIAEYAASLGESVDADAVHASKSELFARSLSEADLAPRPGVVETIREARASGFAVGLVTTTSAENVAALMEALEPSITTGDFDLVVDASDVEQPKPDAAAYRFALETLEGTPESSVAIEDNVDGVAAATAAGLTCFAFPGENNAGHDFDAADRVVERVDFAALRASLATA